MADQIKLTPEQEAAIRAQQELQEKIQKVSNEIATLLAKEGLAFYVDHIIKIVPQR